ncbi:MAG: hypothetical protein ABWY58_10790 [Aeromicrobium sp.]
MDPIDPYLVARRVRRATQLGVPAAELRTDLYEHVAHGVVAPAYLGVDPLASRISIAIALMGSANALGGWASLHVRGNTWFDGSAPDGTDRDVLVHCRPGSQLRVRNGIRPSQGVLRPVEVEMLGPYAATTMARATYDEMLVASHLREAVVVLDMATSTTSGVPHTTLDQVVSVVDAHHKTRGIAQARSALALSSSRSASPWETRTRLVAQLDVGIEGLLVNVPVFTLSGELIGIADLFDPRTGLVIESDGSHHRGIEQHADDNVREEGFERAGCVVCRVVSLDHSRRWPLVGRIAAAHRDAKTSTARGWTLDKPDWWHTWPAAQRWA